MSVLRSAAAIGAESPLQLWLGRAQQSLRENTDADGREWTAPKTQVRDFTTNASAHSKTLALPRDHRWQATI